MQISRRTFLKLATAAASLGLTGVDLFRLKEVFASGSAPPVIWLQGAVCTGCSISLLNSTAPAIDDILFSTINLQYHPNLMTAAGELAIATLTGAAEAGAGEFILCVEGGIPTSINGRYSIIGERNGEPWTMLDAVMELGCKAKYVLAVGTCASFGGVVKPSEYTGVRRLAEVLQGSTKNPVINLPACPVNPIVLVGTLVRLLTTGMPPLDSWGRPADYYGTTVHHICPRLTTPMVTQIGVFGCYEHVGCKGPHTSFTCPNLKWNNGVNWCIDKTNTLCIGCSSPNFPSTPFYGKLEEIMPCCATCEQCKTCVDCSHCANLGSCTDCVDCSNCSVCAECDNSGKCPDCANAALCADCPANEQCSCYTGTTTPVSADPAPVNTAPKPEPPAEHQH